MSLPTPRYSVAITESPPPRSPSASLTPHRGVPNARRPSSDRGPWTLLLLPPARRPGQVRTVALGRRHLLFPLVAAALVLGAVAAGAARYGRRAHESRVAPEMARVRQRLAASESERRTLGDSLGALRAEVARLGTLAALAPPRPARRPAVASVGAPSRVARRPTALPIAGLLLPLDGRITSHFARSRAHPILRINRPHRGVDIAAASGTPIVAPSAGRVVKVGREIGYGLVVHLDHGNGVTTRFAHCSSALVTRGERVAAGTAIATVGATGLATRPHLHYEVRIRDVAVDPLRVSVRRGR